MDDQPSPVRVGILTTDTLHHVQFVQRIAERHEVVRVFEERRTPSAPFQIDHAYEAERDAYERDVWFDGDSPTLADVAPVSTYTDLNEPEAVAEMQAADVEALIVFGTGRLDAPVLNVALDRTVNLHGAPPEKYRGLDTHLWAIYHGDFDSLSTTLHKVRPEIEYGGVVLKRRLAIEPDMKLYQLRRVNTEACVEITMDALTMFRDFGQFISQPQVYVGRSYSFMPSVLKERCLRNFETYTASLAA